MERIYFDKQVFSYLFKGEDATYQNLCNKLIQNKQNYIFQYSEALLLDLKTSDPIIREKELEFIESIVSNNFLYHNAQTHKTINQPIRPIDAFNSRSYDLENFSFSKLFDDLVTEDMGKSERELIQTLKSLIINFKFNLFDETQLASIPENLKKIVPFTGKDMSIQDFMDRALETTKNLIEDKSLFKEMRKVVSEGINNGKFILHDDETDFNDQLKLSEIKKTFKEFVYDSVKGNKKEVSNFDFHTNAYMNLEILGITKEPSKSIKFRNLQNDSFHSYYGGYSDIVVSDDTNFVKKSKAIYKLNGIDTNVLSITDFISWFDDSLNYSVISFATFFDSILSEIKNGEVVQTSYDELNNRKTDIIKSKSKLLNYFNTIYKIEINTQIIYFVVKRFVSYSYFTYFQEIEYVVNITFQLLGADLNGMELYNPNVENKQIDDNSWDGRKWISDGYYINLQINSGTNEFGLMITKANE